MTKEERERERVYAERGEAGTGVPVRPKGGIKPEAIYMGTDARIPRTFASNGGGGRVSRRARDVWDREGGRIHGKRLNVISVRVRREKHHYLTAT